MPVRHAASCYSHAVQRMKRVLVLSEVGGRRILGVFVTTVLHLSRTNRLYECSWKFCRRRYFEYVLGSFVNAKGCTNYARNGVVCIRHTVHMERNTFAVMKDVPTMHRREEFAGHMGLKLIGRLATIPSNNVVRGGVCRRHGAKVKTCKHEGCTNQVVKGGVCIRHGA